MKITRLQLALLTALGLGYLRPAPGTWGSLPAVGFALWLVWLSSHFEFPGSELLFVDAPLLVMCVVASAVCLRFGARAEQHFGRKDASGIVADEVAGQSLTLLFLPWRDGNEPGGWKWNFIVAGTAFFAFRLMDIIKLPPARSLQRLPGGVGVVIDDLVAAIYAMILTQVAVRFLWPFAA